MAQVMRDRGELPTGRKIAGKASFFLGAAKSVCWIVTRDGLTTIPLPSRGEIERLVRDALQELRDPSARRTVISQQCRSARSRASPAL